jgi:septum site-determining protein MinC
LGMQQTSLEFKGLKHGLYAVYKGSGSFEDFLGVLEEKLKGAGGFFEGAYLAGVYGIELDDIEEDILAETLESRYGMKMKRPLSSKDVPPRPNGNADMATKFVYSTLRSGQRISYEGNVVILGDVNAGAEVEAGGSIVVMGSLRGSAKAGMPDNHDASISAVSLQPIQLRIGGIAVRWPDEERQSDDPEMAYIEQGKMYVRPIYDIK